MPSPHRTSVRDPWLDNAKFTLVALVVVGHSLTLLPATTAHGWVYQFLYAWHVPAFVLVTGYLSRSFAYRADRLWSLARTVVVPYLVFEGALALFRTYVGGEHLVRLWLNPHWPMWYLAALFFWRLMGPAFKALPAAVAVSLAVVASLLGGTLGGDTLDHARILGLLPFFVLGLVLRKEHIEALRRPGVAWGSLAALAALFVTARFTSPWLSMEWLYYRTSYADMGVSTTTGMLTRLAVLTVGLVGSLAVLALVPATRTWFTRLGAATLVVYLFHGFAIKGAIYTGVPAWATAHPVLSLSLLPCLAIGLAALLAAPPLATRLSGFVDPVGWLNRRLPAPDPARLEEARAAEVRLLVAPSPVSVR